MYWESDLEGLQSIHITGKYTEFSLIEDQTIDIDGIEEIKLSEYDREHYVVPIRNNTDKINEVIRALKHLNKEIQSIKEK